MRPLTLALVLCAGCAAPDLFEFTGSRLDLGAALPGTVRLTQVKLINESKDLLHLAGTSSTSPDFSLVLPVQAALPANATTTLMVHHVPPLGSAGPQSARLAVWTDEGLEATLEVLSLPTTPECELPAELDFGVVKVGEPVTLELALRNSTTLDDVAEVGPLNAPPSAFGVEQGRYAIRAGGEVKLPITLNPTVEAHFEGSLMLRRHQLCKQQPVRLIGTSVRDVLTVEPESLTWLTPLGATQTQVVILKNLSLSPVALSGVQTREGAMPSQVFRAARFPVRIPAAQRLNGGAPIPGEVTIEVSFTPNAIGSWVGELVVSTDLPPQPLLVVDLIGVSP